MAIPGRVAGAGNNSLAVNVIKVVFSEATADIPRLEAWDDYNLNSTSKEIFTGTTGNGNIPMISAVATTDGAPASADWKPTAPVSGGATANRLKGTDYYVNLASAAVAAGGAVLFNLCWEIPYDITIDPSSSDEHEAVFAIKYSYSGAAPVLTWYFNNADSGGNDSTPVWEELTPGVNGHLFQPTDAGCVYPNLVLHVPPSGTQDNPELWVVESS